MYLKNNSKFQCGLRTKREILTIKPGEVVQVLDSDIISLNTNLIQVKEAEFTKTSKTKEAENKEVIKEEVREVVEEIKEPIIEQPVVETPIDNIEDATEVKVATQEKTELEKLEEKLEALKIKWEKAAKPARKSMLQKQIKQVQDEISKLKG